MIRRKDKPEPKKKTLKERLVAFMGRDSKISDELLSSSRVKTNNFTPDQVKAMMARATPAPGVLPKGTALAMDDDAAVIAGQMSVWAAGQFYNAAFAEGYTFMGYAYLAELAQIPEYRIIADVIATEATRRFIKIKRVSAMNADEDEDIDQEIDPDAEEDSDNPFAEEGEGGEEEAEEEIDAGVSPEEDPDDDSSDGVDPDQSDRSESGKRGNDADLNAEELGAIMGTGEEGPDEAGEPGSAGNAPGGKPGAPGVNDLLNSDPEQDADPLAEAKAEAKKKERQEKNEKIKQLEKEFERLKVRELFQTLSEHDSWFGRSHLYIDQGKTDDREEMKLEIGDGTGCLSQNKVIKNSILALRVVEPIWCYPSRYNANDPLKGDWYNPERWFVMAKDVHRTRFLTFCSMPVPDIMKPAFSFGGLSRSQMAKPYIDNWLSTRQAVNDLIQAFSTMVLSTNMQTSIMPGNQQVLNRADLFNNLRNNRNLMMIDKDTEEFQNVSVPLGTLDTLQAQAQEHICAVSRIPLVKYTGISPQGLNASSEGEIRAFYDTIHAYQEKFFGPHLWTIFRMLQLNLWGEVDEELTFDFEPLWELDEKTMSDKRYQDAQTDTIYIDKGVLAPEEVRAKIVKDPDQPYGDLDPDEVPETQMPEPGNIKERLDENGEPVDPAGGEGGGEAPFGQEGSEEKSSGENPEGGTPMEKDVKGGSPAGKNMNLTGGKKQGKEKN